MADNEILTEEKQETAAKPKGRKRWIRVMALILVAALAGEIILRSAAMGFVSVSAKRSGDGGVAIEDTNLAGSANKIRKPVFSGSILSKSYEDFSAAIDAGDWETALRHGEYLYSNIKNDSSAGPYLRQVLAQLYYLTGRYGECAELCGVIVEKKEDEDGSYVFMKGISLMQTGDWKSSKEALELALESDLGDRPEESIICRLQILSCEYNLKEYEAAAGTGLALLKDNESRQPGEPVFTDSEQSSVETLTAVALLQTGRYEESIGLLDKLIEKLPEGEFYYYRGIAKISLSDYDGGAADLNTAVSAGLDDPDYLESAFEILEAIREATESYYEEYYYIEY